ncbi:MAG: SGNH/GDSL hydrolase family protein [Propionibacteriaceae bacterium]|jgi:lysophospholipase L1-like esterase|nr:SGNH/GDSL hydrolase family protein [Propionibacteriaceae bacterium]
MAEKYVALGSSFAAGPGIPPIIDIAAMRSGGNYPHLLAEWLEADLTDLSVSGATAATIMDTPHMNLAGGDPLPPQLSLFPDDATLVTITVGGNDMGFIGSMLYRAWERTAPDSPIMEMLRLMPFHPVPGEPEIAKVAADIAQVVATIRLRAPQARGILVDDRSVIDDDTTTEVVGAADLVGFRRRQEALRQANEQAAQLSGAELLRASELSAGHGFSAAEPWVFSFSADPSELASAFHPNAEGMRQVANWLYRLVRPNT